MAKIFYLISIFVLVVSIIGCGQKTSFAQKAPDFTLQDLDGNALSLYSFKGKVIILDFFATWCPPCRQEIPDFVELQKNYAGKLQIIGMSLDKTSPDSVKEFAKDYNINYPVAMATDKIIKDYGPIQYIPTTFIIDKSGNIVKKLVGFQAKEVFESQIKSLL